MNTYDTDASLDDIEFLSRSPHRVRALRTLRSGPADRDDLRAATEASKATVSRLLNEFEDRNWVVRDGHAYELTDPGEFVAEEFLRLVDRMDTEHALRDVWQWFPTDLPGCTMSLFADAVVTKLGSHSPYRPFPRFVEIHESARTVSAVQRALPKPASCEVFERYFAGGGEARLAISSAYIDMLSKEVSEDVLREAVESGRLTLSAHDSLSTNAGIAVFDDRLVVLCRDDDVITRVMVDTDAPEAVAWGESIYERARSEARPVDLLERLERDV
jgi:predicted transcriptional regulator